MGGRKANVLLTWPRKGRSLPWERESCWEWGTDKPHFRKGDSYLGYTGNSETYACCKKVTEVTVHSSCGLNHWWMLCGYGIMWDANHVKPDAKHLHLFLMHCHEETSCYWTMSRKERRNMKLLNTSDDLNAHHVIIMTFQEGLKVA